MTVPSGIQALRGASKFVLPSAVNVVADTFVKLKRNAPLVSFIGSVSTISGNAIRTILDVEAVPLTNTVAKAHPIGKSPIGAEMNKLEFQLVDKVNSICSFSKQRNWTTG